MKKYDEEDEADRQTPVAVFRRVCVALKAHRWLALLLFPGIVLAGMTATLLTPPVYESTIRVLVSRERVDPRISAGAANADLPRSEISEEEFNSELEIIRSREVVAAVADEIGLAEETAAPAGKLDPLRRFYRKLTGQPEVSPRERVVGELMENLDIVSVRKSRVIIATLRDRDRELAARALNVLYQKYAGYHTQLRNGTQAADVFQNEAARFHEKLAEASRALGQFDARHGVTDAGTQKDVLLRQYYEMQRLAETARTDRGEHEKRIAEMESQLERQPEQVETGTVTRYNQALDKIKEELLTLELRHTELLQKYQPGARPVREIEQRIVQTRETIEREEHNPPRERSVALNEVRQRVTMDLLGARASLASVREREQRLGALTARYKTRLLDMDQKAMVKTELERTRALNEEAYLLYHRKAQEAEVARVLNQHHVLNVNLVESAQPGLRPVSPRPLLNLAVLLLAGALVALAAVFIAELKDPPVRDEQGARLQYKMKILGRIPEVVAADLEIHK
ncbi:MAG: GumC family protein [Blastocatellia bacterium]